MFYAVKAMPVSYKEMFFAKIFFCMIVSTLSQLVSAILLGVTHYVSVPVAIFIFLTGTLFSFAQVCFATRYDFNHARFSTEDDGEIKEAGSTVSAIIVLGMVCAFLVGGTLLVARILLALRLGGESFGYLTYIISGAVTLAIAVGAFFYLIAGLNRRYYAFSGGGVL